MTIFLCLSCIWYDKEGTIWSGLHYTKYWCTIVNLSNIRILKWYSETMLFNLQDSNFQNKILVSLAHCGVVKLQYGRLWSRYTLYYTTDLLCLFVFFVPHRIVYRVYAVVWSILPYFKNTCIWWRNADEWKWVPA